MAMRPDGSVVSAQNPVVRGETVTIFATGLGQTAPPSNTGIPGVAGQFVSNTLLATVNQRSGTVISAMYQPNTLGVYVIQLEIAAAAIPGPAQPVSLIMLDSTGQAYSSPEAYLPIQ